MRVDAGKETTDPYLSLGAEILNRAVCDARRGDLSGFFYLETQAAADTMGELGMNEDAARQLAERRRRSVMAIAEKRKHRPRGSGPHKPFLILVPRQAIPPGCGSPASWSGPCQARRSPPGTWRRSPNSMSW